MHVLGAAELPPDVALDAARFGKIARLDALARRRDPQLRVEVPQGVYALPDAAGDVSPAARGALFAAATRWLARGPVIVRGALEAEDRSDASLAGQGTTVADVVDKAELRAAIDTVAECPRPRGTHVAVLVQPQIQGDALVVAAISPQGHSHLEVHTRELPTALGRGAEPDWAGPISDWEHPLADAVRALGDAVAGDPDMPHGVDLELIVDGSQLWCVQLRPLAAPLFDRWPEFVAAIERAEALAHGEDERGEPAPTDWRAGDWVLDAEHNPEPLSYAHVDLLARLRAARPRVAGDPTAFGGWLYVRRRVRDLASPSHAPRTRADPRAVLHNLLQSWLPEAADLAEAIRREAAAALLDPSQSHEAAGQGLNRLLTRADDAFLSMIDRYLGELVPIRAQAAARSFDVEDPLSLRFKRQYAHLLLARWDLASPTLAQLGLEAPSDPPGELMLPDDPAALRTLLEECDDLLFCAGLAGLRAVYAAVAERLDWPFARACALAASELGPALVAPESYARVALAREDARRAQSSFRPPLRLLEGQPVVTSHEQQRAGGRARARVVLGTSCTGRLAIRSDLEALLRDPPAAGSIVVMPTLTAAAAPVLAELGVRAVCTEHGGRLSHGALVARELGLNALIGYPGAMRLPDRARARLDVQRARVTSIDVAAS